MSNMPPPPPGGGAPPPPPGGGAPPPPGAGTPPPVGNTGYGQPMGGAMPAMANFGQRLGAILIDGLICSALYVPAIIAAAAGPKEPGVCEDFDGNIEPCDVLTDGAVILVVLLGLVAAVGIVAYWGIMVGKGQTVGMKALSIRVADINTGQPIGTGRGIGRYFAMILSSFLCYLGFLWMLWDDRSQTWHDKMLSTVVVVA